MKIRIKGNSIRLRLTKTDVADLKEKGMVRETTVIGPETVFNYALFAVADAKEITAQYANHSIEIFLPEKEAALLTETEEITVKSTTYNGTDGGLFILIEKDLQCLDETSEDQSDMYQNTKTKC